MPHGWSSTANLISAENIATQDDCVPSYRTKKINGAASRLMVYVAAEMSEEIYQNAASDINRSGVQKSMTKFAKHNGFKMRMFQSEYVFSGIS